MSDVKLMFLDEEYLFPTDLWEYLDALSLTENVLRQLKIELERKVRGTSSNLISTEDMHPALKEQASIFVKKLCEKGIYTKTIDEYAFENSGYKMFCEANTQHLNAHKRFLAQEMDSFMEGVEAAERSAAENITGTGVRVFSSSFLTLAAHAAYEYSVLKDQAKKADAQYSAEVARISREGEEARQSKERNYLQSTYYPNAYNALTAVAFGMMDRYIADLQEAGLFDVKALEFVNIKRSVSLLQNLNLSPDKKAILRNAFVACPYNLQVYLEAASLGVLDAPTVETAERFRQLRPLVDNLNKQFSKKKPSHNLRRDLDSCDSLITALCLCTGALKQTYYKNFTCNLKNEVIAAYRKIIEQADDAEHCIPLIEKLGRRVLGISEPQLVEYVQNHVRSIISEENFAALIDICGYDSLLEQITSKDASENGCTTKAAVDAFYIERILKHIKPKVDDRKRKIQFQDKQRKESAERQRIEGEKTKKKLEILTILLLVVPLILHFVLVGMWCNKIERHYTQQIGAYLKEELSDKSSVCYEAGFTGKFEISDITYYKSRYGYMIAEVHVAVDTVKTNVQKNIDEWDVHSLSLCTTTKGIGAPWYILDGDTPYVDISITVVGSDNSEVSFDRFTPDEDESFMLVYMPLRIVIAYGIYCFVAITTMKKKAETLSLI